jgi:flagellar biosynthesis GTPase FlhF
MASFALHNWNLGDNVKSRRVPGAQLRITIEPGVENEFGIYDRHKGNPTAAYTDQGRDGYLTWKGRWKETISWDRDTMANPPDNLRCVHLTELLADGSFGARHGWMFTDEIEPRFSVSGVSSRGTNSLEEDERVKADVQKRREEIHQLQEKTNQWRDQEQMKVNALSSQMHQLKEQFERQMRSLQKEQQEAQEKLWEESNKKSKVIEAKEKECNEIMFSHDHIHF